MSFPTTPIIDDFNRSDEDPLSDGGSWVTSSQWWGNGLRLVSNEAVPPSGGTGGSFRSSQIGPSAEIYCTVTQVPVDFQDYVSLELFETDTSISSSPDGYEARLEREGSFGSPTTIRIRLVRWSSGSLTYLQTVSGLSLSDGVKFGMVVDAGVIGVWLDTGSGWTEQFSVNDGTHSGPFYPLLALESGSSGGTPPFGNVKVDDFGGGTIVPTPGGTCVSNKDEGNVPAAPGSTIARGWGLRRFPGTINAGTTSLVLSRPQDTQDGDILIACIAHKSADWAVFPAGWTLVVRDISGSTRGEMYWKRASSEPSSWTVTGATDTICGTVLAYEGGLASGDVVDVSGARANASGANGCAAITPTVDNALIIAAVALGANVSVSGQAPAAAFEGFSYSERADGGTSNGTDCRIAVADAQMLEARSTQGFIATHSAVENVAMIAAFVPATVSLVTCSRFYPTVIAPNVRIDGPATGTWNSNNFPRPETVTHDRYLLSPTKINGGTKNDATRVATDQQGDWDMYWQEWNTPPLAAQTVSGNFNLCFGILARWENPPWVVGGPAANSSQVAYKVHVALMVGQTNTVRSVLLDNHVETNNFPDPAGIGAAIWAELDDNPALSSASAQSGDTIRVTVGFRIRSSPTPSQLWPQPGQYDAYSTAVYIRGQSPNRSNGVSYADAVPGTSSQSEYAPWVEFSNPLTLLNTPPSPNTNDAGDDATTVGTVPWTSSTIDTSQSLDYERGAWFVLTAPATGEVFVTTFGSTYTTDVTVYEGACTGGLATQVSTNLRAAQRTLSLVLFDAVQGETYYILVRNSPNLYNAPHSGGSLSVQVWYRQTPEIGDVYVSSGLVVAYRRVGSELVPVNATPNFASQVPSGISIDYTGREMDDLNGGTHSSERLLVGLHSGSNLVEILDLLTLSFSTSSPSEIDFIGAPWDIPGLNMHPAQLVVTSQGLLYVGWFGNGYNFVIGTGSTPRILNTYSDDLTYSDIKTIDAISGDNQSSGPFSHSSVRPSVEVTAPWMIAVDEARDRVYYTSGGVYIPVGGQQIRYYSGGTSTTFATLSTSGSTNPGVRGITVLPDGGLLVCNGDRVVRLDSSGGTVGTYVPTVAAESYTLFDVKYSESEDRFWVIDVDSTRLFLVDASTMTEVATYPTYLIPGAAFLALFEPSVYVPPAVSASCPTDFLAEAPESPLQRFFRVHGVVARPSVTEECSVELPIIPAPGPRLRR